MATAHSAFLVAMSRGWFQGVMSPHTPSGRRFTMAKWSVASAKGGTLPSMLSASDAWYSSHSGTRLTSSRCHAGEHVQMWKAPSRGMAVAHPSCAVYSRCGRPVERVSSSMSEESRSRSSAAAPRSTRPRPRAPIARHSPDSWHAFAEATAASTSAAEPSAVVANCSAVEGSSTGSVAPSAASVSRPSIQSGKWVEVAM